MPSLALICSHPNTLCQPVTTSTNCPPLLPDNPRVSSRQPPSSPVICRGQPLSSLVKSRQPLSSQLKESFFPSVLCAKLSDPYGFYGGQIAQLSKLNVAALGVLGEQSTIFGKTCHIIVLSYTHNFVRKRRYKALNGSLFYF